MDKTITDTSLPFLWGGYKGCLVQTSAEPDWDEEEPRKLYGDTQSNTNYKKSQDRLWRVASATVVPRT